MDRFTRHWNRLWRARGGIASVELALILPLLVLMLFGTIEVGRLLFDFHAASKTVRDATRYLTRIDAAALGLACPGVTVNNAAAEVTNAKNIALTGSIIDPGLPGSKPYLLGYWTDAKSISVTVSCEDNSADTYQGFYAGAAWIPSITVSATVPIPLMNGWLLGLGDTLTFTVSHKEAHFGQ
jgi:Flp pilus assembly protein TadG